jgi:hypothetical protein
MGMMKNYLLRVLEQCSDEKFGQDAIEWAIVNGLVLLTYDLDRDVREIMLRYDEIIEAYRRSLAQEQTTLRHRMPHAPKRRAASRRRVEDRPKASVRQRNAA